MKRSIALILAGSAAAAAGCSSKPAHAPAPAPAPVSAPVEGQRPAPGAAQAPEGAGGDSTGGRAAGPARPRPYNRVITAEARSRRGLFAVHRVNDRLYFEIPPRELGRDQLIVGRFTRAAATNPNPTPGGGGGFPNYAGD